MAQARRAEGARALRERGDGWSFARDHHAEVTDRIVAALEAGVCPWRRPWDPDKAGGGGVFAPRNGATGRRYRGINLVLLAMAGAASGAADPRWLTYRQAAGRG